MIVSQSVTITTKVGSSNPAHGEDYSIKFVSARKSCEWIIRPVKVSIPGKAGLFGTLNIPVDTITCVKMSSNVWRAFRSSTVTVNLSVSLLYLTWLGDVLREFRFLLPLNNLNYVLKYLFEHYIIYIQVDLTRKARKT
jgi:hypothetical protein